MLSKIVIQDNQDTKLTNRCVIFARTSVHLEKSSWQTWMCYWRVKYTVSDLYSHSWNGSRAYTNWDPLARISSCTKTVGSKMQPVKNGDWTNDHLSNEVLFSCHREWYLRQPNAPNKNDNLDPLDNLWWVMTDMHLFLRLARI